MEKKIPKELLKQTIQEGIDACWESASDIMDEKYHDILCLIEEEFNQELCDLDPITAVLWFEHRIKELRLDFYIKGYDKTDPNIYVVPILMHLCTIPEFKQLWDKLHPKQGEES